MLASLAEREQGRELVRKITSFDSDGSDINSVTLSLNQLLRL